MLEQARYRVADYKRETIPFLGLNRSDEMREGEFAAMTNMSTKRYPYLAPRESMQKVDGTEGVQALFAWDGVRITAKDGQIWHGDEAVCNVTDGPKQFAVVNTKLVVWPDAVVVDLKEHKAEEISASVDSVGTVTMTTNSIQMETKPIYGKTGVFYRMGDKQRPWLWTYGSVAWSEETGWTTEDGQWTQPTSEAEGRYYIPEAKYSEETGKWVVSQPQIEVAGSIKPTYDGEPQNSEGFYCEIVSVKDLFINEFSFQSDVTMNIFWAKQQGNKLTDTFKAGDALTITGTPSGARDVEKMIVQSVDTETNTITFADNTFVAGDAAGIVESDISNDAVVAVWDSGGKTYRYRATAFSAKAGYLCVANRTQNMIAVYDTEKNLVKEYNAESVTSATAMTRITMADINAFDNSVSVTRPVPDMDFICQHDNRLWGVSSEERTIYASALGDPTSFYNYSGLSTDSYSVAVGSEGDFTGICSYGNAVLCWKERTLHKVMGTLPENYQYATYHFPGVKDGAGKSLVNINETLFYVGCDGVYAYQGNMPSLISKSLGNTALRNAVAGTDGRTYYLSTEQELLCFDTQSGLWTRWDETKVIDMARLGDDVEVLSEDGIHVLGKGESAVDWEAVFVPMYEAMDGKQYNKLVFRAEVPRGSWLAADVRFDDGNWIQAGIVRYANGLVHMPVPLRRCDKFQIRLRGSGRSTVLDMVRVFRLRGAR